jgi:NTE family protein
MTELGSRRASDQANPFDTVFALAGGGNLGAIQVGMIRALLESEIRPDALVGVSVGALNGAFLAGHADVNGADELAELWCSVRRRDVFPMSVGSLVPGIFGRRPFLFESVGLASILRRAHLGYSLLEDAPMPLRVVATDLATAEAVVLSKGGLTDALLASSAIPGVFRPVELNGRLLIDGGVAASIPVAQADALGSRTIYVLPTIPEIAPPLRSNALVMLQRGVAMAARPTWRAALERVASHAAVHVLPVPPMAGRISIFDFKETRRLIHEAYAMAVDWLEQDQRAYHALIYDHGGVAV